MSSTTNSQKEVEILLESLLGSRLRVESIRKKSLSGNKTKYTIIVIDTAIPDKNNKTTMTKKSEKKVVLEKPKEKVIIATKKPEKKPEPSCRPPMADIQRVRGY